MFGVVLSVLCSLDGGEGSGPFSDGVKRFFRLDLDASR
jgi:hypothetical protein